MDADLDTLATELYVRADDLLKAAPQRAPWRPATGICPQISDAELNTLAVMQALLGFTSEARWLRHARKHLTGLFPYLPGQPGYNRRGRGDRPGGGRQAPGELEEYPEPGYGPLEDLTEQPGSPDGTVMAPTRAAEWVDVRPLRGPAHAPGEPPSEPPSTRQPQPAGSPRLRSSAAARRRQARSSSPAP